MQLNQAVKRLKAYSQTTTIQNSGISFVGTIINGLLGVAYFFLVSTKLTASDFGRLSIAIGIITVGYSIMNFGLDQSIKKYQRSPEIISNIISVKLIIALITSLVPLIITRLDIFYRLIGIGIASQLLFSMSTTFLQAWQKYISWSTYMISTNLLRLVLTILNPTGFTASYLFIYFISPLVGFLAFILFNQRKIPKLEIQYGTLKKLFSFSAPLSASSILSAVIAKLDTFFIAGYQNFASAGIYTLITQVVSPVPQLISAYSAVTSPVFATLDTNDKNRQYLRKNLILSSVLGFLLIPTLFIFGYILFILSGKDFIQAFWPLLFQILGMVVFFLTAPLFDSILYYHGDSKIFLKITAIRLVLSILSGYFIIRIYGQAGAAVSFFVTQLVSAIMIINKHASQNSSPHHR